MSYVKFEVGVQIPSAEWDRPGKPEWSNHLVVQLTRRQAIHQLASLAQQLEGADEGDDSFQLTLHGKLTTVEES